MKSITIAVAALAAFMARPATADEAQAIFHTSPLPCVPMSGGGMFCGLSNDLKHRVEDGHPR